MTHPPATWTDAYPHMRTILTAVITANRGADHPLVDVTCLERVRHALGQLDRGTYRPCTQSPPGWCPTSAFRLVRTVANVTSLGHPQAGAIHRLAADLADEVAERQTTRRASAATAYDQPATDLVEAKETAA